MFRGPNGSARAGRLAALARDGALLRARSPGSRCVAPATPADAKGLLKTAIRDDNPVLFIESETLYSVKGEVPDDPEFLVPLGKAHVEREGKDVTIVAWSRMVHVALEAAAKLAKEGIDVEVVDLRSLRPLDDGDDPRQRRARRTARVVVDEGWPYGGVGAEIVDRIQRLALRRARRAGRARARRSTCRCRTTRSSSSS